jgi:hypothetical protein
VKLSELVDVLRVRVMVPMVSQLAPLLLEPWITTVAEPAPADVAPEAWKV